MGAITNLPDDDVVEKCAMQGMSRDEIARLFGVADGHLEKYKEAYNRGFARMQKSLRQGQLEKALKLKDTTMLIHLGKVYLGQADKQQLEVSGQMDMQVVNYGDGELKPYDDSDS